MKKSILLLLATFIWLASNSQTITDTTRLRSAINQYIKPNAQNQISAAQLNRILNGVVNVLPNAAGGGSYGVSTWNGRLGSVFPVSGDYSIGMITGGLDSIKKRLDSIATDLRYPRTQRMLDSLFNLRAGINTKLAITDAASIYTTISRTIDSLAALQARIQTKEPLISAGSTGQYWRGDKSWQTLDKAAVGLSNVDNTSDANKPISTATQTALDGKVPTTRTVNGHALSSDVTVTKSDVGLSNVPNTDATNAANISSGTLPDARLSSNVTLQGNSFNAANQLVKLDGSGKLPTSTIPSLALVETFVVNSQAAMLALSAQMGDVAVRTDNDKSYILQAEPASTLGNWVQLLTPSSEADPVYTASSWFSTTNNASNWNTAFGWGNHASAGYAMASRTITINGTTYDLTANRSWTVGDVVTSGSYSNPAWITALAWAKLTGVPSTFTPSAHTHPYSDLTGTVPTWNQNTTGNAATATTAANTTAINGLTSSLTDGVSGSDLYAILGQANSDGVIRRYNANAVLSFLGFGSWSTSTASNHLTLNYSGEKYKFRTDGILQMMNGGAVEVYKDGSNTIGVGPYYWLGNTAGTRNWVMQLNASNNLDFWHQDGGWAVRQRFGSNGSITTTGYYVTEVTSNLQIVLNSSGANYGFIQNNSTGVWALGYGTSLSGLGTSVLTWNTSGNVAVTNSLSAGTDISALNFTSGNNYYIRYNGYSLLGRNAADNAYIDIIKVNSGNEISIASGGNATVFGGSITATLVRSTGDVIAYYTSDRRLKKNIKPIENALHKISLLSGNEYDWDESLQSAYKGHDYGVIAQEVERVLPGTTHLKADGFFGIKNQNQIIALLVQAIKELKNEVELLKK